MRDFYFYLEEAKKKKTAKKAKKPEKSEKLDANASHTAFPCPNCKGYGKLENEDNAICPVCKGRGEFNSDEDRKAAVEQQKINAKIKPRDTKDDKPKKTKK